MAIIYKTIKNIKRNVGATQRIEYFLTISEALQIVRKENSPKSAELYNYLLKFKGQDTYIIKDRKRKEYEFSDLLGSVLQGITEGSQERFPYESYNPLRLIKQASFKDGKYRVDFLIPDFSLIIEYDEQQHEYQRKEDIKRMSEIDNEVWLLEGCEDNEEPCTWIRVKEGYELDGIRRILKELSLQEIGF